MRSLIWLTLLVAAGALCWWLTELGSPERRDSKPGAEAGASESDRVEATSPDSPSTVSNDEGEEDSVESPSAKEARNVPPLTSRARKEYGAMRPVFVPSMRAEGYARIYGRAEGGRAQIRAHAVGQEGADYRVILAASDAAGDYELFVPPGKWRIRNGVWVARCEVEANEEKRLDFGTSCRGDLVVIVNGNARQLRLAQVRVVGGGEEGLPWWERQLHGLGAGPRRIDDVPCGGVEVTVVIPTETRGDRVVLQGRGRVKADEVARVELDTPDDEVRLVLLDDGEGVPIPGVRATLQMPWGQIRMAFSDAHGRVAFRHMARGRYQVLLQHPDYREALHPVRCGQEPGEATTLRMSVGHALAVRVTDIDGRPLETELHALSFLEGREFTRRVLTDKKGQAVLQHWPPEARVATFTARAAIPLEGIAIPESRPLHLRFQRAGGER